jgi:hypothetical protein
VDWEKMETNVLITNRTKRRNQQRKIPNGYLPQKSFGQRPPVWSLKKDYLAKAVIRLFFSQKYLTKHIIFLIIREY